MKACTRCGDDNATNLAYCQKCTDYFKEFGNPNRYTRYNSKYGWPEDVVIGVYGWTDYRGDLVYIGKTKRGAFRIWEHYNDAHKSSFLNKGIDPKSLKQNLLWHGDCEDDMKVVEDELIDVHRPVYNIAGNKDKIIDLIEKLVESGVQTDDYIRLKMIIDNL